VLTVEPLTVPDREELIVKYLKCYSKELSPGPAHRIAAAPQTGNGLYLNTLLNELRQFGSYEQLNQRIDWYLQAANPIELYGKVIEHWEQDYGQPDPACENVVRESLVRLWAARRGLSETELLESLGTAGSPLPRAYWSPLFLAAGDALLNRGGLLVIGHTFLFQAVRDRYLASELSQRAIHLRIADYFQACNMSSRRVAEEPWQLLQAGALNQLAELLTNLAYVRAIFIADRPDLLRYWARIEDRTPHRISDTYRSVIENPQQAPEHLVWLDYLLQIAGDEKALLRLLESRERLARSSTDPHELLACLDGLSAMYFKSSQKLRATNIDVDLEGLNQGRSMQLLREHEDLARHIGDKSSLQSGLGTQAQVLIFSGQYWLAHKLLERQQQLCEEIGDRRGLARCLGNLAFVHNQLFEEKDAFVLQERAEDICREIGDIPLLVEILDAHGHAYADLGRPYEAIALWQEEAKLAADLGFRSLLRNSLGIHPDQSSIRISKPGGSGCGNTSPALFCCAVAASSTIHAFCQSSNGPCWPALLASSSILAQ
jgi:tetratricopeptide (TPR) repeat protein